MVEAPRQLDNIMESPISPTITDSDTSEDETSVSRELRNNSNSIRTIINSMRCGLNLVRLKELRVSFFKHIRAIINKMIKWVKPLIKIQTARIFLPIMFKI